jgi:hypothetical protein
MEPEDYRDRTGWTVKNTLLLTIAIVVGGLWTCLTSVVDGLLGMTRDHEAIASILSAASTILVLIGGCLLLTGSGQLNSDLIGMGKKLFVFGFCLVMLAACGFMLSFVLCAASFSDRPPRSTAPAAQQRRRLARVSNS